MTIHLLHQRGQSASQIAQMLGVTEGAVRYHRRRKDSSDTRKANARKADEVSHLIQHWMDSQPSDAGQPNIGILHDRLVNEHHYDGSYKETLIRRTSMNQLA